jgi:hypothetical protein
VVFAAAFIAAIASAQPRIIFREGFEDSLLASRGWYDNTRIVLAPFGRRPESRYCSEYRFLQGARTPTIGGGIRRLFPETDTVYLSYFIRYGDSWTGSNKPYHPHQFSFLTNVDSKWIGPARTHLTTYVEENEGTPMVSLQDALNIDTTRIKIDLTDSTELRAIAGCNGDPDGDGLGDCYYSGGLWNNGKSWRAPHPYFTDSAGPFDKRAWHRVEALFRLNSIVGGRGAADGAVAYWFDGVPVIDAENVVLRTAANPTMMFNQFIIAPYIGDGSPVDQTFWVDDLTVATGRVPDDSLSPVLSISLLPLACSISVNPNPTLGPITIAIQLPSIARASVEIRDALGRLVSALDTGRLPAGESNIQIDPARQFGNPLAPGAYAVILHTPTAIRTARFLVSR